MVKDESYLEKKVTETQQYKQLQQQLEGQQRKQAQMEKNLQEVSEANSRLMEDLVGRDLAIDKLKEELRSVKEENFQLKNDVGQQAKEDNVEQQEVELSDAQLGLIARYKEEMNRKEAALNDRVKELETALS